MVQIRQAIKQIFIYGGLRGGLPAAAALRGLPITSGPYDTGRMRSLLCILQYNTIYILYIGASIRNGSKGVAGLLSIVVGRESGAPRVLLSGHLSGAEQGFHFLHAHGAP